MKKVILFISIISYFLLNAQEGLHLDLNVGYGFPAGQQTVGVNQNNSTITAISGSFNQGLNLGLNFGYNSSKYIGVDLGLNYLLGTPIKSTSTTIGGGGFNSTEEIKANFLFIQPSLTLSPGFEKLNPYVSFGPNIGFGGLKSTENIMPNSSIESEFTGGIPIGFRSALGANYKLTKKLYLNLELFNVNMSYAPSKSEVTKATSNGQNVLGSMSIRDKRTDFVESYDMSSGGNSNDPRKQIKTYLPLSTFGVNLGIRFFLGGSTSSIPVE